jgi:Cdc6-like AAA superfamily ATPase
MNEVLEEIKESQPVFKRDVSESKLKKLIYSLENENTSLIKDKKLLIDSLKRLDTEVVGMERLKEKVAQQVSLLLYQNKLKSMKGIECKKKMMSVMFYGPQGTGKSSVGAIYARILYSLGYLKGRENEKKKTDEVINSIKSIQTDTKILEYVFIIFLLGYFLSFTGKHLNKYLIYLFVGLIFFFLLLIFVRIIKVKKGDMIEKVKNQLDGENRKILNDSELFTIVSRGDLVGGYLGQTAPKTLNILESNRGKVLFIDEAHSLCRDDRDCYGKECLDTIVKFLSENPEYVVIFAGYSKDMKKLLSFQQGLQRRSMFTLETEKYTPEELCQIFKRQLKKDGFKCNFNDRLFELFEENKELFINAGGDTERLVYYCQLFHSEDNINSDKVSNLITFDQVKKGIEELRMNKNDIVESNPEDVQLFDQLKGLMKK